MLPGEQVHVRKLMNGEANLRLFSSCAMGHADLLEDDNSVSQLTCFTLTIPYHDRLAIRD